MNFHLYESHNIITNSFGSGYCGLHVERLPSLLKVAQAHTCGPLLLLEKDPIPLRDSVR